MYFEHIARQTELLLNDVLWKRPEPLREGWGPCTITYLKSPAGRVQSKLFCFEGSLKHGAISSWRYGICKKSLCCRASKKDPLITG